MQISENELKVLIESNDTLILYFKTNNCGVCTAQLPIIEKVADKTGTLLKVVNLSENRHLAASQMVLSVPVTKVFDGGREIFKQGAYADFSKLEKMLQQLQESK